MTSSRPDLVVPVRDRRQHRRILTLRNFGLALLAFVAIFAGITITANLRKPSSTGYGRLYGPRVQPLAAVERKPEVIREGQITDAAGADPTLVAAQARSQILMAEDPTQPQPVIAPQGSAPLIGHDATGRLVVVGGPEGVKLVQQQGTKPVLGGGFGRQ